MDTHMDRYLNIYAEWKKFDKKEHIAYDSIQIKF